MLHKTVYYENNEYVVSVFDHIGCMVEVNPRNAELETKMCKMIIANTPFLYRHASDVYELVNPNRTTNGMA
jgi:hypothetical protein